MYYVKKLIIYHSVPCSIFNSSIEKKNPVNFKYIRIYMIIIIIKLQFVLRDVFENILVP